MYPKLTLDCTLSSAWNHVDIRYRLQPLVKSCLPGQEKFLCAASLFPEIPVNAPELPNGTAPGKVTEKTNETRSLLSWHSCHNPLRMVPTGVLAQISHGNQHPAVDSPEWQPKSKSKNFHLRKKQKLSERPGPPQIGTPSSNPQELTACVVLHRCEVYASR